MRKNEAQYTVTIPTTDLLGQPLSKDFGKAAHHWLYHSNPNLFYDSTLKGPHMKFIGEENPQWIHHLVTVAPDTPETDSYIKQLGTYLGEAANHSEIPIHKFNENGAEYWHIPNQKYREGEGAHPSMLEPSLLPQPLHQ